VQAIIAALDDPSLRAHTLGIADVRFTASLTGGGGGSAGALGLASAAVTTGDADDVVTVMALQQADHRLGRGDSTSGPYAAKSTAQTDFSLPYGMVSPGQKFAMSAKRHMHLFGTTREH
jgi:acetyl-CoA acetyltransferase